MRAAHGERLRAKRLLRDLAKGARAARRVMDPGDEAIAFLPDGRTAHMLLENGNSFVVREVLDESSLEQIAARWASENAANEAIQ